MQKVLFGLAMLAYSLPAYANVPMPRDFIKIGMGTTWCLFNKFNESDRTAIYPELSQDKCENTWIEFTPYGFRQEGKECTATKVTLIGRSQQFVTPVYDITFRCHYINFVGSRMWNIDLEMFIARGALHLKHKGKRFDDIRHHGDDEVE